MHRHGHWNNGDGHDVHGAFETMPLLRIALPAKRKNTVQLLAPAMGQITSRGRIGDNGQKEENRTAGQIRKNRDKVPQQRGSEVRPDMALARIGNEPIEKPGAAQMADGNDRADGDLRMPASR